MSLTRTSLTRAAGLCAVAAGLLFILIQPIHPTEELAAVTGTAWAVTGYLTIAFAVLALIGVSGIYHRQVEEAGVLGLVGYLLLSGMFLLTVAFNVVEVLVLPPLADEAPAFVEGVLGIFGGTPSEVDLGALGVLGGVSFALYFLGSVLLGVSLWRARVLARWASALLVIAALSTLAVPLLPHAVGRYAAVPMGVALVGLGASLWSERRASDAAPAVGAAGARRGLATAE